LCRIARWAPEVEIDLLAAKYEGYIRRQSEENDRTRQMESVAPDNLDYEEIEGLSGGGKARADSAQIASQAARMSGLTPTAIVAVPVHLRRNGFT
jgi:tRNA U34 5-carboxymethylaminomethyl modifying enzyme MnmG/GidA